MKKDTRQAGPWADKVIYMGQDLPVVLRPWQKKLLEELLTPPDDRTIVWYYDPVGSTGKSKFIKYCVYHHKMGFVSYGQSKDIIDAIAKQSGKSAYLANLTRAKPALFSTDDLYSTLESVKDGMFIKQKYNVEICMQLPAHVVVFANVFPDLGKMSKDRWRIHQWCPDTEQFQRVYKEMALEGGKLVAKVLVPVAPPPPQGNAPRNVRTTDTDQQRVPYKEGDQIVRFGMTLTFINKQWCARTEDYEAYKARGSPTEEEIWEEEAIQQTPQ